MFFNRKAPVIWAASAVVLAVLVVGAGQAAPAKPKVAVSPAQPAAVGLTKMSVPSHIIAGSSVTSGRAFYKSSVPENTLAGIRLGRPAQEILSKWGNPSRITLGTVHAEAGAAPTVAPTGPAYIPPDTGAYGGLAEGLGMASQMLGLQSTGRGLPGLPGYGMPGMPMPGGPAPGMPGMPGTPGTSGGGESAALSQEEVTWTYDLHNGITLEFIITEGTITQITVGGVGPWGLSRTRTGLQLGDSYKLVLWVCGYPESQRYSGRFLRVSYVEKHRALYTFLNKKLVGVTIALVQDELSQK